MIDITLPDQGTINTTLPDPSDPMYQPASLCLFLKQTFASMRSAGLHVQKAQIADLTSYQSSLGTWLTNAQAREDEILTEGASEVVANLPDVLAIGAAYMSGGATAAIGCIQSIVLKRLFGGDQAALAGYQQAGASEIDLSEIVEKLDEFNVMFDKFALIEEQYSRLEAFFNNLTINLNSEEWEQSFAFTSDTQD